MRFDLHVDLVCVPAATPRSIDGIFDAALEHCLVAATVAAPVALHGRLHHGDPAPGPRSEAAHHG